ncbi:MAG: DUF4124 domain-containing protein [Pseudomonadales bacterium]|jgi:hypothetical protein
MKKDQPIMRTARMLSIPLFALLLSPHLSAGQVYKWVDEEGVTHYGERAPADKDYSLVKTYGEVPAAEAKKAQQRLEQQREAEKTSVQQKASYEEQQKIAEEQAKIRAENCRGAQSNLKAIQENARVRILGEDGEFRFLTEQEIQEKKQEAEKMIEENCSES